MGYVLRFGVFELNLVTEALRKFGTPIKLAPQPFKVLALLASQAGQVVTREQIQLQVWGEDTYVDFEQGMNHCIKQIRNALSDTADTPRYIETLPRRGYRFIVPVEARKLPDDTREVSVSLIEPEVVAPDNSAAAPPRTMAPATAAPIPVSSEAVLPPSDRRPEATSQAVPESPDSDLLRPWRIVALAAIFIAIGLAMYVAWRSRLDNQQASLSPSSGPALHQRKSVAVLGFQNVSGRADAAWYSTYRTGCGRPVAYHRRRNR